MSAGGGAGAGVEFLSCCFHIVISCTAVCSAGLGTSRSTAPLPPTARTTTARPAHPCHTPPAKISPAGGVSARFSLPAGPCGLRSYGFPCAATVVVMDPGGQSVCTHAASRRWQKEPGCRAIGFSGMTSVGYPRPPETTRRILLPQRFSVDSGPVHEQHAPADHERRPGDKFCHFPARLMAPHRRNTPPKGSLHNRHSIAPKSPSQVVRTMHPTYKQPFTHGRG